MLACKICILEHGIPSTDDDLFQTQKDLNNHLEGYHHMVIVEEGESEEQAIQRFLERYPEAEYCPDSISSGFEWTMLAVTQEQQKERERKVKEIDRRARESKTKPHPIPELER